MNTIAKISLIIFLSLLFGCNSDNKVQSTASPRVKLTISSAISLKDVMEEIKPVYQKKYPQVEIIYNFASSGSLQRQIEQGAPVDVFISAAMDKMDALQKQDLLLPKTRRDLFKNQMVLIVPQDSSKINNFTDLTNNNLNAIALGEPNSVPAGKYAQEILTSFNIAQQVNSKAVYAKDVRQVLNYVATGNADAGIVYLTDAQTSDRVKIVATAPATSHSPIVYPVAVIKDSSNPEAAKNLVEFLTTAQVQTLFINLQNVVVLYE